MSKKHNDSLFQLIKTLNKAEKRNFKLYVKRLSNSESAKFTQLFDIMDKLEEYDEAAILKRNKEIKKIQLSNLKAHLYKQLLLSLRIHQRNSDKEISIREQIDYAKILYNKGLYLQSLKILDKTKTIARKYERYNLVKDIIEFEKRIESQFITRSIENRADMLTDESLAVNNINYLASTFSNIALKVYGIFLKRGYIRSEAGRAQIRDYFEDQVPPYNESQLSFYERLHLFRAKHWYYHLIQDFVQSYKYASRWVQLFSDREEMIGVLPDMYLKGLDNYLHSLFYANYYSRFEEGLAMLKVLDGLKIDSDNIRTLSFQISFTHRMSMHFMKGEFKEATRMVPSFEEHLPIYEGFMDKHQVLNFYYKIGCAYFGAGDYKNAIHYLNKIVNTRDTELRSDLHTYARILVLISYFEMKDYDYVEYLLKSTYRFLLKKKELYEVLKLVMQFIRRLPNIPPEELKKEFENNLEYMKRLNEDPFERRPFLYLDFISWLESKVQNIPVDEVVQHKFHMVMK